MMAINLDIWPPAIWRNQYRWINYAHARLSTGRGKPM
jgi:hypothetical protein